MRDGGDAPQSLSAVSASEGESACEFKGVGNDWTYRARSLGTFPPSTWRPTRRGAGSPSAARMLVSSGEVGRLHASGLVILWLGAVAVPTFAS